MKGFSEIEVEAIEGNTFKLLGTDWMLVTAGPKDSFNTMTASWGGFGILWNRKVCFCFIRPSRHTYKFMEESDSFTLSFFDDKYKSELELCGTKSGRNVDKIKETGFTPVEGAYGSVYFQEARLVFECKKIYFDDFDPDKFLADMISAGYPDRDYHRMYIGEIMTCLKK